MSEISLRRKKKRKKKKVIAWIARRKMLNHIPWIALQNLFICLFFMCDLFFILVKESKDNKGFRLKVCFFGWGSFLLGREKSLVDNVIQAYKL